MEIENQTLIQKKIALAQGEYAPIMIEILRECIEQVPLVGKTEWETIVNAITLDTQSSLLRRVVDRLEEIRAGALHEVK